MQHAIPQITMIFPNTNKFENVKYFIIQLIQIKFSPAFSAN